VSQTPTLISNDGVRSNWVREKNAARVGEIQGDLGEAAWWEHENRFANYRPGTCSHLGHAWAVSIVNIEEQSGWYEMIIKGPKRLARANAEKSYSKRGLELRLLGHIGRNNTKIGWIGKPSNESCCRPLGGK